ncbi:MobA/MobL family protein [Salmonella enterica]|uniref:Molybdopterin-guanine dinucleotide biosynthesis protein MobA n=1 Tax=Salmonella enterica TaxID=28901 RepID=A0A629KM85_SALER|nr:molybdopterin-guanine dinucleotide biosynthesis protein MobA [Salmonella enterica]EDF8922154.1 molybdopterin-guanine dinucleotide biosynthesis protein MobA [Salmonella enterica]EGR6194424.1 MobA/MobL family protein [Salmonella enterica]EHR7428492.1 MobA/MobL family protein [Salmonella enterica]EJF2005548.1 MobA/MobL family protein [Salmonella enterica]
MAIYSFKMENISRGEGKSSVASAAYRHRKIFTDNRTGDIHGRKTVHKKDLYFAHIFAPENTPPDLIVNSETLWNAVEASEKRKDARLAKEFKIALPAELTPEQSIELTSAFVFEHFTQKGIITDVVIHDINGHNPHIHIMGTTREVLSTGFGKKIREWDKPETLDGWRKGWQDICNEFLAKYGHEARVDHRSISVQHKDALEQAEIAVTNEEKAFWLAKAEETDRDPMLHIPRDRWNTLSAQKQRATEQAIRDNKLIEAKKTYTMFKELPLEIVIDVRSFTITYLAEPEEIILTDYPTIENQQPVLATPKSYRKPAAKSYRDPNKVSKVGTAGDRSPVLVTPEPHKRTKLKTPTSPTVRRMSHTPVRNRKRVKPRQSGIFKRFTLMIVGYIKEKLVWARKKPSPVSVDSEHDKRIAENYVYDEVLGRYVPRDKHMKRAKFNSEEKQSQLEGYSHISDKEEITRFPSRPKKKQHGIDESVVPVPSLQSRKINLSRPQPPGYRK